jgi:hypothetical protein
LDGSRLVEPGENAHNATIVAIVDRNLILLDSFAILLMVPQRECKPLKM